MKNQQSLLSPQSRQILLIAIVEYQTNHTSVDEVQESFRNFSAEDMNYKMLSGLTRREYLQLIIDREAAIKRAIEELQNIP